jgi:UDP-glucose 4-epimerase
MDVLVTGGAGFIGSHVCRALRVSGSAGRVVVLDDLSSGLEANLSGIDDIELLRGSVTDPAIVTELVERVDAVVHLAAVPAVARSGPSSSWRPPGAAGQST